MKLELYKIYVRFNNLAFQHEEKISGMMWVKVTTITNKVWDGLHVE